MGTSTRADAQVPSQAIHSFPPITVGSRRVDSRETCTYVSTAWVVSRANCLGAWDWWSGRGNTGAGQDTRDNRHVRQHRDAEMRCKWQVFRGVNAVQHLIPGAVRCTAPSGTSEVRMPELVACQSAPAQAVRLASSSSDATAMAQFTGSSGAGSGSICLANNAPVACSSLASSRRSLAPGCSS